MVFLTRVFLTVNCRTCLSPTNARRDRAAIIPLAGLSAATARDVSRNWRLTRRFFGINQINGTTHGIEASATGIQVDLTARIHEALKPYGISGAQHGTSGNSSDKLKEIAAKTATTKANVATALQMISWGVSVNDYGNAIMNAAGRFIKEAGKGLSEEAWAEMVAYAGAKGIKAGDYKKLNAVFEKRLLGQPAAIRQRMAQAVSDFVYWLLTDVFNAGDTAPLAIDALAAAGTYDLGSKAGRIEDAAEWTREKILERAKTMNRDKGPEGDFDD